MAPPGSWTPPGRDPWANQPAPQQPAAPPPAYQPLAYQPAGYPPPGPGFGGAWLTYKPGIINLRPLAIGDILTGALNLIKFNWRSTLGLSAIIETLSLLLTVVALAFTTRGHHVGSYNPANPSDPNGGDLLQSGLGTGVPALFNAVAVLVLAGLLAYVCAEAVLGRRPGPSEAWRAARRRIWPFIGSQVVIWLAEMACLVAVVLLGFLVHALTGSLAASIAIGVMLGLGVFVLVAWLYLRLSLTGPSIMLEGLGVRTGLARSWQLSRGSVGRILGATVLSSLIAGLLSSMLGMPVAFIGAAAAGGADATTGLSITLFAQAAAQAIAYTLVAPFSAGVTTLLYLDARMRREGLDIQLLGWADQGWAPWRVPERSGTAPR